MPQVCPDSAKVQLNMGILERRHLHWQGALKHFQRAQSIEPGYCDPTYWIGLTLINEGRDTLQGVQVSLLTIDLQPHLMVMHGMLLAPRVRQPPEIPRGLFF